MTLAQILSFLTGLAPILEPVLVNLEQGELQPELQKLIASVTNPELNAFLTGIDTALTSFLNAEIAKI